MKMLMVLLGLITTNLQSGNRGFGTDGREEVTGARNDCVARSSWLTGQAAEKVKIRAYSATGEVKHRVYDPNRQVTFTLGTRLFLTCNVTELSEGNEVVSYRWFLNCTQLSCQIRNRDPYYRVMTDTLLVDVTSLDQGGRYYCFVKFSNKSESHDSTSRITVAGQCMHQNCYEQYSTVHHCLHR